MKSAVWLCAISPLWSFGFHWAISLLTPSPLQHRQRRAALSCALGALSALSLAQWKDPALHWGEALGYLALATGGAHIYFHLFNMTETARRIRALLTQREATAAPVEESFERRVARLEEGGHVVPTPHGYKAQSTTLVWAARALTAYERWLFPSRAEAVLPEISSDGSGGSLSSE